MYKKFIQFLCRHVFLISVLMSTYQVHAAHKADLIIFSYDRPLQLYALLESIDKNVTNIGKIYIICRTSSQEYEKGYHTVSQELADFFCKYDVTYIAQNAPYKDFREKTIACVNACENGHIFFAVDDMIVIRPINLDEVINALEESKAYCFQLRMGLSIEYCYTKKMNVKVPKGLIYREKFFVWKFADGIKDWCYPFSLDMGLYTKSFLVKELNSFHFNSPYSLEAKWYPYSKNKFKQKYGICYLQSAVVNIPLNCLEKNSVNLHMNFATTEKIFELFSDGYKIDITSLQNYVPKSPHIHYEPTFIKRGEVAI